MKLKVIRAFLIKGERQEVGTVVEVHDSLAAELIHNLRAERMGGTPTASTGPMTTQSAHQLVDGAVPKQAQVNKKGSKDD